MSQYINVDVDTRYTPSEELKNFIRCILQDISIPPNSTTTPVNINDDHWRLYTLAFISPAVKQIVGTTGKTNKVLEFIGDAAIELAVTDWLVGNYGDEDVGMLTKRRQCIVANDGGLRIIAETLEMARFVEIGAETKKSIPSMFEAFVGAMQEHLGYAYVRSFMAQQLDRYAGEMFAGIEINSGGSKPTQSPKLTSRVVCRPFF